MRNIKPDHDQYYTRLDVASNLCNWVKSQPWFESITKIIDPCAGGGAFSSQFHNCEASDIDPIDNNISCADFLLTDIRRKSWDINKILVISNPPFGPNGSLALEFIKKSMTFADYIGFILPSSFQQTSFQRRLPKTHHLIYSRRLEKNSFILRDGSLYDVNCVFQIWALGPPGNFKIRQTESSAVDFVTKAEADFAIRRVGAHAGKIIDGNLTRLAKASHHFLKVKNSTDISEIKQRLKYLQDNERSKLTAGPRSVSKSMLIEHLNRPTLRNQLIWVEDIYNIVISNSLEWHEIQIIVDNESFLLEIYKRDLNSAIFYIWDASCTSIQTITNSLRERSNGNLLFSNPITLIEQDHLRRTATSIICEYLSR